MGGISAGSRMSSSRNISRQPPYARRLGKAIGSEYMNMINERGFESMLSQPAGVLGSLYQNMFNPNASPTNDAMGARAALQNALSGDAFKNAMQTSYNMLLPSAQRAIEELNRNVLSRSSPMGLRFSSDVMDLSRRGAQDILLGTQRQAASTAVPLYQTQAGTALNFYDLIGSLAQQQMARQAPLAVQLATGVPVSSRGTGGGSGWNAGFNITY